MEEQAKQAVLALIIIKLGDGFRSSYRLCKILSRIFGLINCLEIMQYLETNQLAERITENGHSIFTITSLGYEIIQENKETITAMSQERPDELSDSAYQLRQAILNS